MRSVASPRDYLLQFYIVPLRYLVTGAAGFIGSTVSRLLLEVGHDVVGVDDLNDAYDPRLKQCRLAELTRSPQFQFQCLDISDFQAVAGLFDASEDKTHPYDAVLNLAARAGVRASVANPFRYLRTNAEGTLNLLELCRRFGVKKFVLASTSSLYGSHNAIPFSEDADTSRPLSPYAASKAAAESLAYTYHHLHQLDVSVLRYFTVYGPAGRPDMSVLRFIRQIAESEPITLFGNGQQKRDFTYVDDIARGTVAALKPVGFEIINLGSSRSTSLDVLVSSIARLLGRQPIIHSREAHAADVSATLADVRKAERLLNWKAQVSLDEGLQRTIAWYRKNRDLALTLNMNDEPGKQQHADFASRAEHQSSASTG